MRFHPPSNPMPCFLFAAPQVASLRRNVALRDRTANKLYLRAGHLNPPAQTTVRTAAATQHIPAESARPSVVSSSSSSTRVAASTLCSVWTGSGSRGRVEGKMADVNVPVGEPYNGKKGPGYGNGTRSAGYGEPSGKAHRAHHCLNFVLRLLTAMATAAALTTMYKSNQTVRGARARWNDFAAFKFFLVANAVVLTYATLSALASLLGVVTRRGPLSSTPLAWLTFLMDFLLVNALMAAAASATTIAWIGRRGQLNAGWAPQCGVVGGFCRRVLGALIACYIGWLLLALSTILAAAALHRLRRRHALSY